MRRELNDLDLEEMKYEIVTGNLSMHPSFQYWLAKWPELVKSLGSHESLTEDDFLRQDKATMISLRGEVIAIHCLSNFSRAEMETHPYFKPYGPLFRAALDAKGVRQVQTLQWLMADDAFAGHGFGAVVVCLSLLNQLADKIDASITIARADNAVTNLAIKCGMEVLEQSSLHNVPTSHMACFKPIPHPKAQIQKLVEKLWAKRQVIFIEEKRKQVA